MAEIQSINLFAIDRAAGKIKKIDINDISQDMKEYIETQKKAIIEKSNSRHYRPSSNSTEVFSLLSKIIVSEEIDKNSVKIANRLLRIELKTQDRYKMTSVQSGSLLLIHFTEDSTESYIIIKVEHNSFLDETDFIKHIGLPLEKETLKSCLYQLNDDLEMIDVIAYDTNPTIADYWWNGFLELEPLKTDEENTKKAFAAIENVLGRSIKKTSPADYSLVRNNLIGYFKTTTSFSITEVTDYIMGDYTPINSEIDIEKIKEKINELPDKKGFDQRFEIKPKEIDARIRVKVQINEHVDLKIQNHIEDLKTIICSALGSDGKKYIKIRASDEAFNRFNYSNDNE